MAIDATGAPTPLGIPKFNTAVDAPSGKGSNAQMDAIDALIAAVPQKPAGIVTGEAMVFNTGSNTFVRSSATKLASGNFGPVLNADVDPAAAIAYSKMANPGGTTTFLRADGAFAAVGGGVAPTHLPGMASATGTLTVVANTAYLIPIPNVTVPTVLTRLFWGMFTLVAGNYDVGIYFSDDDATFTQLINKGSTAQPAAGPVTTTIASTTITPVTGRRWYYGIALNSASVIMSFNAGGGASSIAWTGYTKATSFPLPASLTGMTAITNNVPVVHGMV